jgi:predicted nucleotidyltransferase component of viral defense system
MTTGLENKHDKECREDSTLTLMNHAAERFLYRLSQSRLREQFVLKGAMLFAVRIGERYRPTRDLDLLGMGEATGSSRRDFIRENRSAWQRFWYPPLPSTRGYSFST